MNPDQVAQLFQKTVESFGRLDILVNNAGLEFKHPFPEFPFDLWQKVIAVDLTGPFLCAQAAAKMPTSPATLRAFSPLQWTSDLRWRRSSLSNKSWSGSDNVTFSAKGLPSVFDFKLGGIAVILAHENKDWTLNRGRGRRVAARMAKQKTGSSNGRYSVVWRSVFIF